MMWLWMWCSSSSMSLRPLVLLALSPLLFMKEVGGEAVVVGTMAKPWGGLTVPFRPALLSMEEAGRPLLGGGGG